MERDSGNENSIDVAALSDALKVIQNWITELECDGSKIGVPFEYYWEVPPTAKYDAYGVEEDQLTLGQLSDDIQRLALLVEGEDPPEWNSIRSLCRVVMAIVDTQGIK